ncbi:MAG: glucose-6-phosphate dehydrogenase [Patescibacteria group bacterium]|nr:glucose-6-phosphate dehydrogenase [Patescibacteria group bacterium]
MPQLPTKRGSAAPTIYVIFGATGDLMEKKLVPALFHLYQKQMLPLMFRVIGFSRREWNDAQFRDYVTSVALPALKAAPEWGQFLQRLSFQQGLLEQRKGYDELAKRLGLQDQEWKMCASKLFHLAVPPTFYKTVLTNLAESGLTKPCSPEEGWTRVMVEKPFGNDLNTAQELDKLLGKLFKEEQVYRLDHYLGKETVRNVLAFRFSNSFLEPSWNRDHIERIAIGAAETSGISGRGEFYDSVGALRDFGQNHLLQLLALFTMDNPGTFDAAAIRRRRQEILAALKILTPQEVATHTLRGQYEGYRQEAGVANGSTTETYFRMKTFLQTPRWAGVPIYLASGKKRPEDKAIVSVTFKHPVPCLCPPQSERHYRNVLKYQLQPQEGMAVSFWVKKPGPDMVLEERDFVFDYRSAFGREQFIEAYEKLILDAIAGDQTLFVSTREIMAGWRFTDPIARVWASGSPPLEIYRPGDAAISARGLDADVVPPKFMLGYVGLGKMGKNMVQRLLERKWPVVAYNRSPEPVAEVVARGAVGVSSLADMVSKLTPPRVLWLMLPAGDVVEEFLFGPAGLVKLLQKGDLVVDGGNSFFEDTQRRAKKMARLGIRYMDVGVSGGPGGARNGACLMIGGERKDFERLEPLFSDLAAADGYRYFGKIGAGHFVKMVHNGVEYGMMQAIAEGFATLRASQYKLNLAQVADLYNNGSVIESRLVDWLRQAYLRYGPNLAEVSGSVAHTGEGAWTVKTAKKLKVPVPIIQESFKFRVKSEKKPSYTGKVLSALRNQFGGHDIANKKFKKLKWRKLPR